MSISPDRVTLIRRAVADRADDLAATTMRLIAIPTENPPGRALADGAGALAHELARRGIDSRIVPSSTGTGPEAIVVGDIGTEGPIVYLHGHYDVVPAFGPDQFQPKLSDGMIVGRGASDMKSGIAALLSAAEIHRDLGGAGRIRLVFVPDEETGGANGAERLVELGVLDPAEPALGAIVAEPSWPAVWYAARGAFTLRVTVRGRASHVGLHYLGVSAFEHAHRVVTRLFEYRDEVSSRRTDFRIEPEEARRSVMLVGGTASGGTNFNIVPDRFSFTIDRRPNPDEDYEREKSDLLGLLHSMGDEFDLDVETLQDAAPAATSAESGLLTSIEAGIRLTYGRAATPEMCPGCLETRVYTREGIPAVAYGPGPAEAMHGPAEYVPVGNLAEACLAYVYALGDLLGYDGPPPPRASA